MGDALVGSVGAFVGASVKTADVPPMSVVIRRPPTRVTDGRVSTHDGGLEPAEVAVGDFNGRVVDLDGSAVRACVDVDGNVSVDEGVVVDLDRSASGACVVVDSPDPVHENTDFQFPAPVLMVMVQILPTKLWF
jgi:hypothetical protein